MKTLEQILKEQKKIKHIDPIWGIKACKESIKQELETSNQYNQGKTLYTMLESYVERANEDVFFNNTMVLACWELINNK